MMVNVEIGVSGTSFRAADTIVATNDQVQITTTEEGTSFEVVVPNTDGFFDLGQEVISGTVSINNPLSLGTVTGNGKATKYYEFDPGIDAPPRIIRLA
jgi:hypothetical protein